jgi:hypothetical protein
MILHSEKLHDQYPTPNIRMIKSKIMISVDHVARMWERCIQGFGEGKKPLGRPRRRWQDNIKMDLKDKMSAKDWFYRVDLA